MHNLIRFLFGCRHEHVSWPIRNTQTCLDCGKSWFNDSLSGLTPPRMTQPAKPRVDGSWEGFEAITLLMAREKRTRSIQ